MKKYLLIPVLFIAALATSYADCGACGGHEKEKKAECAEKCDSKCCKKKKACCASEEKTEKTETTTEE